MLKNVKELSSTYKKCKVQQRKKRPKSPAVVESISKHINSRQNVCGLCGEIKNAKKGTS